MLFFNWRMALAAIWPLPVAFAIVALASAGLVLRLGIATTALTGASQLVKGELDVLTFFMFLLVVSRLYDPLEGTLQNLAAIIGTNSNIERMNEILDCPRADRQRTAHQSQLRYRVRPCGVCLSGGRNGAERRVLYGETRTGHGTGRAIRRRQDHRFPAGGADQIVVLKDATVSEQGSPAELLQSGGIFVRMVKRQTESQNWTLEKA